MNRWLAANQRSMSEIGVRWVLRGRKNALPDAVRSYVWSEEKQHRHLEKDSTNSQLPVILAALAGVTVTCGSSAGVRMPLCLMGL